MCAQDSEMETGRVKTGQVGEREREKTEGRGKRGRGGSGDAGRETQQQAEMECTRRLGQQAGRGKVSVEGKALQNNGPSQMPRVGLGFTWSHTA